MAGPRAFAPVRRWVQRAGVPVVCLGVGALAVLLSGVLFDRDGGIIGGVAMVVAAGAPTIWRLRRHALDGPGICALATVVLIGLTALAWLGDPPLQPGPGLEQADIGSALWLVAAGLVALGVGALVVGPARAPHPVRMAAGDAPAPGILITLTVASVAVVGVGIALGNYGYIADPEVAARLLSYQQFFVLLGTVGTLVVLITALVYFYTGARWAGILLVPFAIVQFVIGFIIGQKTPALAPLVLVVLAFVVIRRRIPVIAIVGMLLVLFLFVVPANLDYRLAVRSEGTPASVAVREALIQAPELNPVAAFGDAGDYFLTRYRSIDSIALIQSRTPSHFPYSGRENYLFLPAIILVPRVIWPSAPRLDDGPEFNRTYFRAPRDIISATPLTQIGHLYRAFAWPGVVAGMFAWGALLALGTAAYRRWRSPRLDLVYLVAVLSVLLRVDADLPSIIASSVNELGFAALVGWLLLPGRSSGPAYPRLLARWMSRSPARRGAIR